MLTINDALRALAILSLCSSLSACATHEEAGAGTGAIIGGLVGALAGQGHADQGLAIMAGAIMGGLIGSDIGRNLDRQDEMRIQQALEYNETRQPTRWHNPDTGRDYQITPYRTYESTRGPCRQYTVEAYIDGRWQDIQGTACRDEYGQWKTAS